MENKTESALYELRLALYDMIRVTKGVIENRGTILNARKRIEAAEGILKKHFKITDVLRAEIPEPELSTLKAQQGGVTQPPTFWDVAKAFKWAAEYGNEQGEQLVLTEDGEWLLLDEQDGVTQTDSLTPGNVAELYCLQTPFEKDESPNAYQELKEENERLKDLLQSISIRAINGRPTDIGQGTKQAAMLGEIEDLIEKYLANHPGNGQKKEGEENG